MNNIRVVDDIVRETELLMSEFYQDQETSYIFTADHGMSKIGNHGDGGTGSPLDTLLIYSPRALQILTIPVLPSLLGVLAFAVQFRTPPPLRYQTIIPLHGNSPISYGVMSSRQI
jgi:hypothetical protein